MIYDQATDTVIGNLGWVDHGSLWLYSVTNGAVREIAVAGAVYLGVKAGLNGLFRLVHHQKAGVAVSIRQCASPERELASLRIVGGSTVTAGDAGLWRCVEPAVAFHTAEGPSLFRVDADTGAVTNLDLSWFTDANYDLGYQGLGDCVSLPEVGLVAVSVQRSSELVLIDTHRNERTGTIMLAGRGGNPALRRRSGGEFVASDYDCLCLVNAETGAVRTSKLLQEASPPLTQQFIGEYDLGERACAVARPFSGDVLLLDFPTFAVRDQAFVGGQPMDVCMTSRSKFVTRDWKNGAVGVGCFSA